MRIAIIGTGYVGLVTGACLAKVGHHVLCVDNDERKIKRLTSGEIPIYEPGLDELVHRNVSAHRLAFTNRIEEGVDRSEVIFIAVPTPPNTDGSVDLAYIEQVAREIASALKEYRVIVDKSTVPVKTGEKVADTIRRYNRIGAEFDVVSNPEFLREGCAVADLMEPDRIVIGCNSQRALGIMERVYAPFAAPIMVTDINSAELIKHAANSFLVVNDLIREGAHVTGYDPKGNDKVRELNLCPGVHLADSALNAVRDAEALVLATEWSEFAAVELAEVHRRMHTPIVFDGRNVLDANTMNNLGFQYYSIGRPLSKASRNGNADSVIPIDLGIRSKYIGRRDEVIQGRR